MLRPVAEENGQEFLVARVDRRASGGKLRGGGEGGCNRCVLGGRGDPLAGGWALAHGMQFSSGMVALSNQAVARDRLLARRAQLLHRFRYASELADELAGVRAVEIADRANDSWDAHVLSKLGDAETRQLSAVMAALRRLANGTYGICVRCQREIESARLEALPEAALCGDCARYVQPR